MNITCYYCKEEMEPKYLVEHLKNNHNTSYDDYYNEISVKLNLCPVCFVDKNRPKLITCGSLSCRNISRVAKSIEIFYKKYGVSNPNKISSVREKIKETSIIKYGTDHPNKSNLIRTKISETKISKSEEEKNIILEKRKKTVKQLFGVDYTFQSEEVKEKIKETNLERYGTEFISQSDLIKHKIKETNLERYGVDNVFKSDGIKEKIKETNLERYGVDHYTKTEEYKNKTKNNNFLKYGVDYSFQSEEVKEKIKETNLGRYGVEYISQSPIIQAKIRRTIFLKYGVDYTFQSEEVKKKIKETNLERYGVEYAIQNPIIFKKIMYNSNRSLYNYKLYTLPSNEVIKLQGYENYYLDFFFNTKMTENRILCGGRDSLPVIEYFTDDGKKHKYFPDFYIPEINLIVEVKSKYTLFKDFSKNISKKKYCELQGYEFLFAIYDVVKGKPIDISEYYEIFENEFLTTSTI